MDTANTQKDSTTVPAGSKGASTAGSRSLLLHAISVVAFGLRSCAWAALGLYVWWSFVFVFPSWSKESRGDRPFWAKWRSKTSVRYHMAAGDLETFDGKDVNALLFWWFPLLVAALCSYLVAALSSTVVSSSIMPSFSSRLQFSSKKVCRTLTWPIPGQRFWLYWCDGLNLAELLAILAWVVGHCVCLWDHLRYSQIGYNARSETGFRMLMPLSVQRLKWISLGFAWLSMIDLACLFLPISHNSFLMLLTGLPYSALIRFHRWIGHSTMWMVCLHGAFFCFYWISDPQTNFWDAFFDWGRHHNVNVLAGIVAVSFGLVLWITSLNWCRRKYFEVYYKAHMVGFIGFIFFAMMHYSWLWTVIAPGMALFAGDMVLRVVQAQHVTTVQGVHVSEGNIAIMELSASKDFSKCPMQDLFLMIPSISRWQWHPFTIMGKRDNGDGRTSTITLAMKMFGGWTQEAIAQLESSSPMPVRMTGALDGINLQELKGYNRLLLLAGGIAVTPLLSLLQALREAKARKDAAVEGIKHVELIWATRSALQFTLLPEEVVAAARDCDWLSVKLFNTSSSKSKEGSYPPRVQDAIAAVKGLPEQSDGSGSSHSGNSCPHTVTADGALKVASTSAFFWNIARPMQPKSFGTLYGAAVVIFAFIGAFLGLVVTRAMDLEWQPNHDYYKYGLATFLSIMVYTIGLPMTLVVLPINLLRYMKNAGSDAFQASRITKGPDALDAASVQAEGSQVGFVEHGLSIAINSGRPDLEAALMRARLEGGKNGDVAVFCAGPPAMNSATQLLVQRINRSRQGSQAHLDFHKYAFEL